MSTLLRIFCVFFVLFLLLNWLATPAQAASDPDCDSLGEYAMTVALGAMNGFPRSEYEKLAHSHYPPGSVMRQILEAAIAGAYTLDKYDDEKLKAVAAATYGASVQSYCKENWSND